VEQLVPILFIVVTHAAFPFPGTSSRLLKEDKGSDCSDRFFIPNAVRDFILHLHCPKSSFPVVGSPSVPTADSRVQNGVGGRCNLRASY
jgi:hypothetical protein